LLILSFRSLLILSIRFVLWFHLPLAPLAARFDLIYRPVQAGRLVTMGSKALFFLLLLVACRRPRHEVEKEDDPAAPEHH